MTNFPGIFIGFWIAEGIALGAHRGFTHKSFKMTTPLKVFLLMLQTMSGQVKRGSGE